MIVVHRIQRVRRKLWKWMIWIHQKVAYEVLVQKNLPRKKQQLSGNNYITPVPTTKNQSTCSNDKFNNWNNNTRNLYSKWIMEKMLKFKISWMSSHIDYKKNLKNFAKLKKRESFIDFGKGFECCYYFKFKFY